MEFGSKLRRTCIQYGLITVATLIMVVGIYVFKFPNNFSFGGVTGIAVLLAKLSLFSASTWTFILNMALLVLGFLFLGKSFGIMTVYVSVLMSVGLSVLEKLFPMSAPLTNQPVLELIFAIFLPAFASAILFNVGASGGGTDILAMILKKYTPINIGTALFCVLMADTLLWHGPVLRGSPHHHSRLLCLRPHHRSFLLHRADGKIPRHRRCHREH